MITVLTTPRRTEYLRDTLRSIDAAGAATLTDKTVFVDGVPTPDIFRNALPGWSVLPLHPKMACHGTRLSLWRILNAASRRSVLSLLHFEDDVRLCKNAIPAMYAIDVPTEVGFLSFFQQNKGMSNAPGFHGLPIGQSWWGCQAIKVPSRSLDIFRNEKTMPPLIQNGMQCDVWIGKHLWGHVLLPSLVRHVGLHTTIPGQETETLTGESAHRAGLHYVGDDFDALNHPFCPPLSARTTFGE